MVLPGKFMDYAKVLHDDLAICAPVVSQFAALAALTGPQDYIQKYLEKLDAQRKYMIEAIKHIRHLKLLRGQGAFYLFPQLVKYPDSEIYCQRLAKEANLLFVSGRGFGPIGASHVRLSFINSIENITEAFQRLKEWENINFD